MARMTLEEIAALDKNMLLATDVAPFLECDDGLIRLQAQTEPDKLGFPVIVMGSRVKNTKSGIFILLQIWPPGNVDRGGRERGEYIK